MLAFKECEDVAAEKLLHSDPPRAPGMALDWPAIGLQIIRWSGTGL